MSNKEITTKYLVDEPPPISCLKCSFPAINQAEAVPLKDKKVATVQYLPRNEDNIILGHENHINPIY